MTSGVKTAIALSCSLYKACTVVHCTITGHYSVERTKFTKKLGFTPEKRDTEKGGLEAWPGLLAGAKEGIKEQSTPANLSATARRVLRCTKSQKPSCSFKEIFFGYFHLTVPETASQKGFKSVK